MFRGAGYGPLHVLLLATAGLPMLAFAWGTREGQVAFVLFREPKLALLQALGWSLLAALAWARPGGMRAGDVRDRLRRPSWAFLAVFLAWSLITALWVEVPQNLFFELGQFALLFALVLALDAWSEHDSSVLHLVELGLVASVGFAAAVGIVQAIVPIPILSPIDPRSAASNPSFFGYKSPMALAVAGQIFLLGRCLVRARPGRRAPLGFLIAAELAYLVSLKSRTAWAALAATAVFLACLVWVKQGFGRWLARAVVGGCLAAALFGAAVAADPELRWRAASVSGYLVHPVSFLESDRGTYLINTLNMVRHHPLGVGFGDWQTQYPVYRRVHRDLYFSDTVQVRKAHSDPVQILGETGWPGLALWLGFVGTLLARPVRRYLRDGDPQVALLAAQVLVLVLAMFTDSLLDHPCGKLQFLLIALLGVRAGESRAERDPEILPKPGGQKRSRALAAILTLVASGAIGLSAIQIRKSYLEAGASDLYREALQRIHSRPGPPRLEARERELLESAAQAGESAVRLPGYTRESCDDLLFLAHAELLLGRREKALTYARASLLYHPYNPGTLSLMALLVSDRPAEAGRWRRAYKQVMQEATAGFEGPYPDSFRVED